MWETQILSKQDQTPVEGAPNGAGIRAVLRWKSSGVHLPCCLANVRLDPRRCQPRGTGFEDSLARRHRAGYWYGFKPSQKAFLEAGSDSWLALEGERERILLLIPFRVIETLLPRLGVTPGVHWHFLLHLNGERVLLWLRGGAYKVDLTQYVIPANGLAQSRQI